MTQTQKQEKQTNKLLEGIKEHLNEKDAHYVAMDQFLYNSGNINILQVVARLTHIALYNNIDICDINDLLKD